MNRFTTLAVITASLFIAAPAAFAAGGNDVLTKMPNGGADILLRQIKSVGCTVAGTPSEFPDDIAIRNTGSTLPAGTKINWSVPNSGKSGTYTLSASLAAGKGLFVSGVLPGGVEAGNACVAKII